VFAVRGPQHHGSTPGEHEHREIFYRNRGAVRKKWLWAYKSSNISEINQSNNQSISTNHLHQNDQWLTNKVKNNKTKIKFKMRQDSTKFILLKSNRKSYMRFLFVPKSTTLDDLERSLYTLFQNIRAMLFLFIYFLVSHSVCL